VKPERWQEVKKVLAGALERTPPERRAYLDQACSDDSLRREVESLVAAHERGDSSFMGRQAVGSNEMLQSGTKLGPYEVLARQGAGGMGVVYRARDGRLERDVAIKVLPLGLLGDETARKRFRNEALALAKLNHPNIAAVYDVGEQEGTDYLVMEFVHGKSLAEEGPVSQPEKEAVALGAQIAAALEEAHEQGIVHRDLKPGNIMVTPKRQVKVLDFGLAKILRAAGESSATESFSQTQNLAGTLPYMAPEQLRGEPADARTDVHALGAVLFEIVTGQRPYREDSVPQLTDAILHQQPVAPRALNARLSPELERIILKCLEKERENRYQSAKEIGVDLRRLSGPSAVTVAATARPASPRRMVLTLAGALVVALALAVGGYFYFHRTPKLTEKDSIVLADFANTTGDPVFDGTLRQGLSVQLEQTPFLQLVSDDQIGQTLRLMEKPPNTRLTPEVAREVCQRANATTEIEGSIAALGSQYVLGLNAVNCISGETLAGEQVTADGKERVLAALTTAAIELRSKFGESRASLEKFDVPLSQATTSSLEALKALSSGFQVAGTSGSAAAIPFFKHAIQLDPTFALAYALLGRMYGDIKETSLSADYTRRAYELRERTSERENYFISASFNMVVTGNMEKAAQTCELWAEAYPRSPDPHMFLGGIIYPVLGQYEKAVEEAREVIQLVPDAPLPYYVLMYHYTALNRLDEAKATYDQALEHKLNHPTFHTGLYMIAFLQDDAAGMAQQVVWGAGKPGVEDVLLASEADTAAYSGKLSAAREFSRQAIDSAERADKKETAATYSALAGLREALFGNADEARRAVTFGARSPTGRDAEYCAALALAYAGDDRKAQTLTDDLGRRFPESTIVQFNYLPTLRAKLAVNRGNPSEALESLRAAAPYEMGKASGTIYWAALYPIYVRGEAQLATHEGVEAATEFQKILDHRGVVGNEPIGAIARLGLGRAYEIEGDTAKARAAYQDFLSLWKDADPDIPILKQAEAEYAKLQ
jgi:eukaryotic-like serine/threonine-protein kinase